uniref:Proteophosphoglycan ppg4 n=1 Tax=Panagrellus redivivus TaxID=6233 RepID=A0A7E4UWT8_PANRE
MAHNLYRDKGRIQHEPAGASATGSNGSVRISSTTSTTLTNMSSDKSTPAPGKPTGKAPAAPTSPRSYAAVLRGEPEAPTPAPAPSSAMPAMSEATLRLFENADTVFAATRAVLAKEKEKEAAASPATTSVATSSSTTASLPGRKEAASALPLPVARQPDVRAEAPRSSSPATFTIRNTAPTSPDLPSSLSALSNAELVVRADRVFRGTRRALYGADSSPVASPATSSDPSQVQAPSNEVPSAFWADLEPLEWAVSASKSSEAASLQGASPAEEDESIASPETPSQQAAGSPVAASPKPLEPVNRDSSASIPFDDTEDLDQADSSCNGPL